MASANPVIIGSIVERKPTSPASVPKPPNAGRTGFPAVQHRSQSAFARNRDAARKGGNSRLNDVPKLVTHLKSPAAEELDDWRDQISRENELRVQNMSEEERERERKEILERFGPDVVDILRRTRLSRLQQIAERSDRDLVVLDEVPITASVASPNGEASPVRVSSPPPALSNSSTRPSSRTDRRLRFAELSPQDVHVYESAPSSPKKRPLALPPPPGDGSAISLGQWKPSNVPKRSLVPQPVDPLEPEEGTPEYIRRRYFPGVPKSHPDLAWIEQSASAPSLNSDDPLSLRFDLSGKPIPPSVSASLPTHLGLHHHAEGKHAGYTMDDIFLLSRSTVPAQRATMLGVLAHVARRLANLSRGGENGMHELMGKEEELRKRIIAAGIEAMSERGSVGARAVEVVWQCVVGWDEELLTLEGVELEDTGDVALRSLQPEFFFPRIMALLHQGDLAQESRIQLLGILIRLAQQSNDYSISMTTTPQLIQTVVQRFVSTPITVADDSCLPEPLAIDLLTTLAKASRANALVLRGAADVTLRFITILPTSSTYPAALATSLLTSTLRFYRALASYGLYSQIASTAMMELAQLGQYILSDTSAFKKLAVAWMDLLQSWIVCAIDPHQTTPGHDILWSQIIAWGWNEEVINLRNRLGTDEGDWDIWAGVWEVSAAWLEGSKVNGIRAGSAERAQSHNTFHTGFLDGFESIVVTSCIEAIMQDLASLTSRPLTRLHIPHLKSFAKHTATLASAIRLFLASLPPVSEGPPEFPPFYLPFSEISNLCAKVIVHPVWSLVAGSYSDKLIANSYLYLRSPSYLLSVFLRLSKRLPGTSQALWTAQVFSILTRLLPGDEDFALEALEGFFEIFSPRWVSSLDIRVPPVVWEKGGLSIIKPFLTHTVCSKSDVTIGPTISTPRSILLATTQCLPSKASLSGFGLPLPREWTLAPLDHLLQSGISEVFKSIPASWNASETDITLTSLALTVVVRNILGHFALTDFMLSRAETIFGCMKVFMLEHDQPHADSTDEVFRDPTVGQLMDELLLPYTYAVARVSSSPAIPDSCNGDLERAAARFLGQTPFFQYYTDFVALYDAISFSHPLFARLLLPPLSMRYAVDYRKHLWNDYRHIVKTIRVPVGQVITADIGEYLWPVERNPQVIGAYLGALLKDHLQGFVHLAALHHVASNIWVQDEEDWNEDRARKLLHAVAEQGSHETVREVVLYCQPKVPEVLEPPDCFGNLGATEKVSRLEHATRWGLRERLKGLFDVE